jgi:valyl-tRNA synthetase
MKGYDVLWVPGTDHAGISTQSVVKKHLDAEGIDYRELGREGMIERIWKWKEKYGDQILLQLRRLGCSCDWTRTRFTMDEGLSNAVNLAFKRLYDDGLIYRGQYIVNWCPVDRTALSDDEVNTKDGGEPGFLWHLKYPFADGSGYIEIATTRPETMLGDTAIAVNPKDARFQDLIGKEVVVPLVERTIQVIGDDFVDPEFGTGCVKVTPAHDPNDFQIGLRHELAQINIMNEDATLNDEVPEPFRGMDRFKARKAVVQAMEELGLLVKVEERNVPVGRSYRSKAIIEYRLSDQWFVKMRPLAEKALASSQEGALKWHPERWDNFYRSWLENTRDWCISRQVWWGHRIPAWYHKDTGEVLVDTNTPVEVQQNPEQWMQDEDVLDTWFSSALWPYSTLGWPESTADLKKYYPTSILVTGKDIIFFWVARMVMTGLYHLKEVPFHEVLINSIICDEDGETMSKSKGNGIDPLHVIDGATREELEGPIHEARPANMEGLIKRVSERFPEGFQGVGADALRYTMLTSATDAQQAQVSLKKFDEVGRPLTNKIWNASKLALGIISELPAPAEASETAPLAAEDRWILTRLNESIQKVSEAYDTYAFHHATGILYHFFWDDLCDWYLEIIKPRLRKGNIADTRRIAMTLSECFLSFLRMLHPIMPFITEELWGHFQSAATEKSLFPNGSENLAEHELCATSPFPEGSTVQDVTLLTTFSTVQEIIRTIRNMRAKANVSPKSPLEIQVVTTDVRCKEVVEAYNELITHLANLGSLTVSQKRPEKFTVSVVGEMEIFANLLDFIDVQSEIDRTKKAIEKIDKQISALTAKLSNEGFVSRAPIEVVNSEKEKLREAEEQRTKLEAAITEYESLQ